MALDYITKKFNELESKEVVIAYKVVRKIDDIAFAPVHVQPKSAKDFCRYNKWHDANTTLNIETNQLVREEEQVIDGTIFKKVKVITKEYKEKYTAGFHCYLDKEEAYEAWLECLYEKWDNSGKNLETWARYCLLLPCKCTDLICEGIQDGHRVIVAKRNYVFNTQEIPLNTEEDINLNVEEIENEEVA